MINRDTIYRLPGAQKLISFEKPVIMAIVNLTSDSFYTASRYEISNIIDTVGEMITHGADIIDIGAMSSRPGATELSQESELESLLPVMQKLRITYPDVAISVDTYRSEVVRQCHMEGLDIVNDISAGNLDENMLSTVGKLGLPYILMHMKGLPKNMQEDTFYEDLVIQLLGFLANHIAKARKAGIKDLIIDPGIGFGKSIEDNFKIVKKLKSFAIFDLPIMVGLSRKSFIYKTLQSDADNALNGSTAMHMLSLINGANILRVHDVKEAVECINLLERYLKS